MYLISYFCGVKIHEFYILRCIQIAKNGLGTTAPNPMVGAVIVYNNSIIGEGFTSTYGGSHAEVNAINSVKDKSLLKKSTLYVTLEPCAHFGKTPPCADLIVQSEIPIVIIGLLDPYDEVAGKGIEKLKNAGCTVITGVLEEECREHHKRFLTFQEKKRPYIVLKWAETEDGFIAPDKKYRKNTEPFWITNDYSKQLVHKWRTEEQSILVGTTTVLEDNPQLNARLWNGKNPIRIVLDKSLKIDSSFHVLDGSIRTMVFTAEKDTKAYITGVEYHQIDFSKNVASQVCEKLYQEKILSVFIEGGTKTIQSFIDENLWDEARIFTGPKRFHSGTRAPQIKGRVNSKISLEKDQLTLLFNA
ncbi:bifunctional diaminohydroxyphosphoribosylaminopyrimidine deaminase/5-amino-6-(5-phosphoribosylamino)uracil reductase RibD [Cellulophaga sp. Hel_I_12]|uniref:bifunctional diaminohydroxyphosphoribosylaminopyrimidine deaminase/5-amino-6-(5-phosphoribosylamino)uracil reductase RibD n=1 Tax=Cellulophaga sp. Hel_I_12 TaxID=1249972 RepID=UPI000ACDF3BB|nr:bifunctional diaminohydroxyphosphoribosylaminopyrimidine deaminase/5-amino-6-(5-phosphoribosylamino)uracil reductase RibD [Cellulophaga sp. Hel_I_12]